MSRERGWILLLLCLRCIAACEDGDEYAQNLCVLVDESGTYADQRQEVAQVLRNAVLPALNPGAELMLVRIDSQSYDKKNIEATLKLAHRPSQSNAQKLAFLKQLERYQQRKGRSRYTDIRGGMMLCSEHLSEVQGVNKTILIFSDLKEDLKKGTQRQLDPNELSGTSVLAMNVKRLKADSADPSTYRGRLLQWERTVRDSGAKDWQVVRSPERLRSFLSR